MSTDTSDPDFVPGPPREVTWLPDVTVELVDATRTAWLEALPRDAVAALRDILDRSVGWPWPLVWPCDPNDVDVMFLSASAMEMEACNARLRTGNGGVYGRFDTVDDFVRTLMFPILEVAVGAAPVVMLTPAQQYALWFTEPPEPDPEASTAPAFDGGVLVLFAEPILCAHAIELPALGYRSDAQVPHAVGVYLSSPGTNGFMTLLLRSHNRSLYTQSGLRYLSRIELDSATRSATFHELLRFAFVVKEAAYTFGMTGDAPEALRPDRAERRRRERAAIKNAAKPKPRAAVRYLRDHANEIRVRYETTPTGRVMPPHFRIGHFRKLRTGSMVLPKDERPTVRRYVPPCIVNSHLGTPEQIAIYRERTKPTRE